MKRFFNLISLIALLVVAIYPTIGEADDTEIYGTSTADIRPNVLIIFDNSGSMSDEVIVGDPYNPATTYDQTDGCQGQPCATNAVYRWRGVEQVWQLFINDVSTITCATARNSLQTTGTFQGRLRSTGSCTAPLSARFATGNYINWLTTSGGTRTKMDVAKEVITNIVSSTFGVDFGVMVFNQSQGGQLLTYNGYTASIKDMDGDDDLDGITNRLELIATINSLVPDAWTPLAETLYEAGRYFAGAQTAFNGSITYTSPIQYSCQTNYVIFMTDGMSTEDRDSVLQSICNDGDCDGDGFEPDNDPNKDYSYQGSDYLDDVAKYLYDNDLMASIDGTQRIVTYTIGFGTSGQPSAEQLLRETAQNGGGRNYSAGNTQGLSQALGEIIGEILAVNTSFVAPVVPVSPENKTYSGNYVYMGFFRPSATGFWSGNIKKYGIDAFGNILDMNGNAATNSDGTFKATAISYWSTFADGGEVEEGGAGGVLLSRSTARNLYTYKGNPDLTDPSNVFATSNANITISDLAVADSTERDKLIRYIQGEDSYNSSTQKRDWILGDILHSEPLVIHYSSSRSVIYVGANDGMLHTFEDSNGSELWGFIPPDLLNKLKNLPGATHSYFVDSSPKALIYDKDGDGNIESIDNDMVILIFGERRGGSTYYFLDVTNPDTPSYITSITTTGTNETGGQSWSEPLIGTIKVSVSGQVKKKAVFFIGGGYDDTSEDARNTATQTPADTTGRAVYVVEIGNYPATPTDPLDLTGIGDKIWEYDYNSDVNMTYSMPSNVTTLDMDGNGYIDRLYVGDNGGRLWRFDVGYTDISSWGGYIMFTSNPGADASTGRKIFYAPDVVSESGYDIVYVGTGDREHPKSMAVVDRMYAIKDIGYSTTITESDLTDATTEGTTVSWGSAFGWYIRLSTNSGEKVVSEPMVFNKVAYFTTYDPDSGVITDVCTPVVGTGRVYALHYKSADAILDLDNDSTTGSGGKERSIIVGSGIPSGVVIGISSSGKTYALIGVGGAAGGVPTSAEGTRKIIFWRKQ